MEVHGKNIKKKIRGFIVSFNIVTAVFGSLLGFTIHKSSEVFRDELIEPIMKELFFKNDINIKFFNTSINISKLLYEIFRLIVIILLLFILYIIFKTYMGDTLFPRSKTNILLNDILIELKKEKSKKNKK